MITYVIVVLITLFFSYMAQGNYSTSLAESTEVATKKSIDFKIFLFIIIATLTVTAGCRYYVGSDYGTYLVTYEMDYAKSTLAELLNLDEPMLPLMGRVSYLLFDSFLSMFLMASLVSVTLVLYSTYKETDDFVFVTMLYIFTGAWTGSFNGIRQYLAIAICFLGRRYIAERKIWKFLLVCALAFLAHKSAIFFILVYFIYSEEFLAIRLIVITAITIIIARNYETLFEIVGWIKEEELVLNFYSLKSVNLLRILANCAPAVLALYYGFTRKLNKQQIFYAYMLVANAATWIVTSDSAYLARLALYTTIFVPLALSEILKAEEKKYANIMKIGIVALYGIFWFYEVSVQVDLRNFRWVFDYL